MERTPVVSIALIGFYHVVLVIIFAYLFLALWPAPWPPPPSAVDSKSIAPTASKVADTKAVEANAADTKAPDTKGPDTKGRDTRAPEATAAQDIKAAEAKAAEEAKVPKKYPVQLFWGKFTFEASFDGRLILIVLVSGGLGAYIHAASSLVDYVGNQKFQPSWILWYLLRPFIGMALALVLYIVVRAGFISVTAGSSEVVNVYGIASIAALAGLFSKQASDKLNEVFTTAFRTAPGTGDAGRKHKLVEGSGTTLLISSIKPSELRQGAPSQTLVISGSGFIEGASCAFNGAARQTDYKSATELGCTLIAADTADVGLFDVTVKNPGPGGQASSGKIAIKA